MIKLTLTIFYISRIYRKLPVQSVSSVYLAISELVYLSQHEPERLMEPTFIALDSLVPLITFVKENDLVLTSPTNLINVRVILSESHTLDIIKMYRYTICLYNYTAFIV